MELLGYALAALIGILLGIMGGGGSILTVPVFVYVLGFDPKLAIAMSLPVVGTTSLIGAMGHWKSGNVHLQTAAVFGVIAMVGSYAGARLAEFLSGTMQLLLLAIVMLGAAMSMLFAASGDTPRNDENAASRQPISWALLLPVAIAVGLITGIVGIGGGFLVVPALVVLARVPIKQAIGTSLLVIAMNALSGFAGYLGSVEIPWRFVAGFTAVASMGILVGTYLVRYVSARVLKQGFAVFLLVMGLFMLYKNSHAFRTTDEVTAASAPPHLTR